MKKYNKLKIKKYYSLFQEAIPISKVRPFIKGHRDEYKDRLSDWFNGKWRIYIPLKKGNVAEKVESDLEKEIKQVLQNTQYELKDFEKGIAYDSKNKRDVKLGKILGRINKDLLNQFSNADVRQGSKVKNVLMVISKHPYDILGQSYDRGWTSCKELGKGINEKYLKDEVFLLLIAYLVYEDDKNIKKPIARVLATPYFDRFMRVYYEVNSRVYGSAGEWENIFINTFKEWLKEKQKELIGIFKINPFVYSDNMTSEIDIRHYTLPSWVGNNKPINFLNKNSNFIWKSGTWEYGTWIDGIWKSGIWKYGTWKSGIWKYGTWKNGTWKKGIWEDGIWEKGIWEDGIWKKGIWEDGIWEKGIWKKGTWEKGTWEKGTWEDGIWEDGIWEKGIWEDGIWKSGIWKSGIWKSGYIYDKEKIGNFEKDWEWKSDYVLSKISPKEYFRKKK